MTETAEQRTKRTFTNYLKDYEWPYQYSIFYRNIEESKSAVEHSKIIRNALKSYYRKQPFLWRLCLIRTNVEHLNNSDYRYNTVVVPFHTIFTTEPMSNEELCDLMEDKIKSELYTKKRRRNLETNLAYATVVLKAKPHELNKHFKTESKINRFSVLNKPHLKPLWKKGGKVKDFLGDYYEGVLDPDTYVRKLRRKSKGKSY